MNSEGSSGPPPRRGEAVTDAAGAARERRLLTAAWILWALPLLVVCIIVFLKPAQRTVTVVYHSAAAAWWGRADLYHGPGGMNYLPQFAVLFTPFHVIPSPWGDVLWRMCAGALLATGLWRVVRVRRGPACGKWFLWASIVTIPLCVAPLRNGQANALLGGLILHAAACIAALQWTRATALIVATIAVKPLGAVLACLAPVVYAPLRGRMLLGLAALTALPFLCGPPHYALSQYEAFKVNLSQCSAVSDHRFANLNGILRTFGTELPSQTFSIVAAVALLAVLALWWFGSRHLTGPPRAMWLHALTAAYLMLFNPMNEANSFVILVPALGFWAVHWLSNPATARRGGVVAAMALSMGLLPNLVRPLFGNRFALFWHPVMTIAFAVLLACWVWQCVPDEAAPRVAEASPT
jgi:hypothetical protein